MWLGQKGKGNGDKIIIHACRAASIPNLSRVFCTSNKAVQCQSVDSVDFHMHCRRDPGYTCTMYIMYTRVYSNTII